MDQPYCFDLEKFSAIPPQIPSQKDFEFFSSAINLIHQALMLQKTRSFAGVQFQNDSELERLLINGHHKAVITAADFDRGQRLKNERLK